MWTGLNCVVCFWFTKNGPAHGGENDSPNYHIYWLIYWFFFSSRININSHKLIDFSPCYRQGREKFLFQQGAKCVIYECYVISFKWMWESNVRLHRAHHITHITKSITINCFLFCKDFVSQSIVENTDFQNILWRHGIVLNPVFVDTHFTNLWEWLLHFKTKLTLNLFPNSTTS